MFTLALALGRNLSEITAMPLSEFRAWQTFWRLSPFGDYRGDLQAGVIASTIANVNRARGTRPFSPGDFVPEFARREKVITEEQIKQKIDRFMRRYH